MASNLSPIKVRTNLSGFKEKGNSIRSEFRSAMQDSHKKTLEVAKDIIRKNIVKTKAIATENLLNSVTDKLVANNSSQSVTNAIYFEGSASRYAGFAEYGRRKGGNPPPSAIADWMRAKGYSLKNLYWVVINIGKRGTKGHYFLRKSRPEIRKAQREIFESSKNNFIGKYKS